MIFNLTGRAHNEHSRHDSGVIAVEKLQFNHECPAV